MEPTSKNSSNWCLNSNNEVENLKQLNRILKSSIGYEGMLKLLVTNGGYSEVTSSSSTLFNRLELSCPLSIYISKIALTLPDYGLYFGIIVSSMLEKLLDLIVKHEVTVPHIVSYLNNLKAKVKLFITSANIKSELELSIEDNILPLLRTIINSKPVVKLAGLDLDYLSVQIVKVFLSSLDASRKKFGHVHIIVEEASENYRSFNGVLYKLVDSDAKLILILNNLNQTTNDLKLLLFTEKLVPTEHCSLDHILKLLDFSIKNDIKIVVCQKVVDEKIKLFLRKNSAILIERVGEDLAQSIEYLSTAFPISNLQYLQCSELLEMSGSITSCKVIEFGCWQYLLLNSCNHPLSTLIVHTRATSENDDLKSNINNDKVIRKLTEITWKSFLPHYGTLEIDLDYFHAWLTDDKARCHCGLVLAEDVNHDRFMDMNNFSQLNIEPEIKKISKLNRSDCYIDCYETKCNALLIALDTVINILDIGLIV